MRKIAIGVLLALSLSHAQAASLTLGCSGALTTTELSKNAMASDPKQENVVDMSIIVDFDHRAVTGFWVELNGLHDLIPITTVDANSVTFEGRKKIGQTDDSIGGTVDRITAKVDANENLMWPNGNMSMMVWDLRCKPTKPLF